MTRGDVGEDPVLKPIDTELPGVKEVATEEVLG
jgi:hypothetical protein